MRKVQVSYWYNLKQVCSTAEVCQNSVTERRIYRQTPGKRFYAYAVVKAKDAEKTDCLVSCFGGFYRAPFQYSHIAPNIHLKEHS